MDHITVILRKSKRLLSVLLVSTVLSLEHITKEMNKPQESDRKRDSGITGSQSHRHTTYLH